MAATLDRLGIYGVRSYTEHGVEQFIEFFTPLTVILGENGCGKTTIIECLKQVICGALPPDAKSGQSFISDPKLVGKSETKARIRLRFRKRDNQQVEISRTFRLTQKPRSMQYKALDVVITTKVGSAEPAKATHRCTDVDKMVPLMVGVSRAILTNVVFCHQEDANWPLKDGSDLKKRFDDIFESTRYTKALDDLRATQKEQVEEQKKAEKDYAVLQEQVGRADELKEQQETLQGSIATLEAQGKSASERLAEKQAELREAEDKLREFEEKVRAVSLDSDRLKEAKHQVARLREKQETQYEEGEDQLRLLLEQYEDLLQHSREKLKAAETKDAEYARTMKTLERTLMDLTQQQGKLMAEAEQIARFKEDAQSFATTKLVPQFGGEWGDATFTKEKADRLADHLRAQLEERQNSFRVASQSWRDRLYSLDETVNAEKVALQTCENSKKHKERELQRVNAERGDVTARLRALPQTSGLHRQLKSKQDEMEEARQKSEKRAASGEEADLKAELERVEKAVAAARTDLDAARDQVQRLRSMQAEYNKLQALKKDLEDHEAAMRTAYEDVDWESALGEKPRAADLERVAVAKQRDLAQSKRVAEDRHNEKRADVLATRQRLEAAQKELANAEERVSVLTHAPAYLEMKDTIRTYKVDADVAAGAGGATHFSVDGKLGPREALRQLTTSTKSGRPKYQQRLTRLSTWKSMLDKLQAQADDEHKCPMCDRPLDDVTAEIVRGFTGGVDPDDMTPRAKLAEIDRAIENLQKGIPMWSEAQQLSNRLNSLKQDVSSLRTKLEIAEADLEHYAKSKGDAERDVEASIVWVSKAKTVSTMYSSLIKKRREVDEHESLSGSSFGAAHGGIVVADMSLETAEADIDATERRKMKAEKERDAIKDQLSKISEEKSAEAQRFVEIQNEAMELQAKLTEHAELTRQLEQLSKHHSELSRDLAKLETSFPDIESRVRAAESKRSAELDSWTRREKELKAAASAVNAAEQQWSRMLKQIRREEERGSVEERIAKVEAELAKSTKRIEETKQKRDGLNIEVQRKTLAESDATKHGIHLALDVLRAEKQVKEIKSRLAANEAFLAEADASDLDRRVTELRADLVKLEKAAAKGSGRREELEVQLQEVETALDSEKYRNVHDTARLKMIEVETTKLVIADLDKYHRALDLALMKFHRMKIANLNSIIRDLWRLTYRGGDIDTIEIRSDADRTKTTSRGKRNYNYRVVMTKGSADMDMKGRCSAGQKALASLIIRVALADTFGIHCGILTLDEPTTNLDKENKKAFATGLAQIIAARRRNTNFQLIVITHDEQFVEDLGRAAAGGALPSHYYTVTREEIGRTGKYTSSISKQEWGEAR